ncbi:hypothetical protein AMS68_003736 [Peltaster fructicola]|uniref:Impact N-terminal domain-containing protein n=1 Tax=Peltaster fructicola TaxID=286661 RepID=A0A6H0XUB8_9PEZI|nr:hypothetical protein AMS68_003736 [Peltaster fructicola]
MSTKRKRSASPVSGDTQSNADVTVFCSDEIFDRQSTFRGFFSPSIPPKDLQKLAEFDSADHKILGWRRESNQQSLTAAKKYVTGNDDDGEKYGGKKVEQCLTNANITGACVVARWYGGIMLGPVRFTHMETCALGAIKKWQESVAEEISKKRKVEQDASETKRLVKVLTARDQSITVLRNLASDKEAKLRPIDEAKTSAEASPSQPTPTPALNPVYDDLPLQRLQALEKARDATISFLLKRIDKAELALKELQPPGAAVG